MSSDLHHKYLSVLLQKESADDPQTVQNLLCVHDNLCFRYSINGSATLKNINIRILILASL